MREIYLDNAATSWPKPPAVARAVAAAISRGGGNPGRAGHRKAIEAGRTVLRCRERLAELFNIPDPGRIVFTKNATEALNIVLASLAPEGRVLTTSMEHNSVLRPLRHLEAAGLALDFAEAGPDGRVSPESVAAGMRADTRLVAVTHASNVTGAVNDLGAIGDLCRKAGLPLLVDASQSAGCLPIDAEALKVDYLAFSGHKGLLGPQGTGGLYLREGLSPAPLMRGGTGSLSDREEQPDFMPDRYESGTINVPGLAGLAAGADWILSRGVEAIQDHDRALRLRLLDILTGVQGIAIYGPSGAGGAPGCTGLLSVTLDRLSTSETGELLERRFGVMTRIGLHCAPRAHRTIGTFPHGTVRLSWGPFTTERDIVVAGRALAALARE